MNKNAILELFSFIETRKELIRAALRILFLFPMADDTFLQDLFSRICAFLQNLFTSICAFLQSFLKDIYTFLQDFKSGYKNLNFTRRLLSLRMCRIFTRGLERIIVCLCIKRDGLQISYDNNPVKINRFTKPHFFEGREMSKRS